MKPLIGTKLAYAGAVLSGVLYWASFAGIDAWPFTFVAFGPLWIALQGQTPKRAMRVGLLAGATMNMAGFTWLLEMLKVFSGFPLPPFGFDPPRAVGVLSLVLLLGAVVAYYAFHLEGIWRLIYVGCAVAALYLNVFVLVAQGFLKVPFLHGLAPTGSEPPFVATQAVVLIIFIVLGALAAVRFRPGTEARA